MPHSEHSLSLSFSSLTRSRSPPCGGASCTRSSEERRGTPLWPLDAFAFCTLTRFTINQPGSREMSPQVSRRKVFSSFFSSRGHIEDGRGR